MKYLKMIVSILLFFSAIVYSFSDNGCDSVKPSLYIN